MDARRPESRIGSIGAMSGTVLLAIGTFLHPLQADPNDPSSAFAEYAADHLWRASHLTQFLGVMLLVAALLVISRRLADGPAAEWAHLGMAAAIGTLMVTAVLQAVDGIALKVMVDTWAHAQESEKAVLFHSAFAVRQIEIGLAGYASMLSGVTALLYGVALILDRRFPRWLGPLGIAGGILLVAAGIVTAHSGFSRLAMMIQMPSSMLLLVWMLGVGVSLWPKVHPPAANPPLSNDQ